MKDLFPAIKGHYGNYRATEQDEEDHIFANARKDHEFVSEGESRSTDLYDDDSNEESVTINSSILNHMNVEQAGDRYYYTNIYNSYKKSKLHEKSDSIYNNSTDADSIDNSSQLSDFAKYDMKVTREIRLKERIDELQNQKKSSQQVTVLNDLSNFDPMDEKETHRLPGRSKLSGLLPIPKVIHKYTHKRNTAIPVSRNLTTTLTNETHIIDDTHGQVPIDFQAKYKRQNSAYQGNHPEDEGSEILVNNITMHDSSFFSEFEPSENPAPANSLHFKLKLRHLQMIAYSGAVGVGLFLSSGKSFSIAGPLGAVLGFILAGSIVLCTMLSYCEMITLITVTGGLSGVSSRFVDDAFGFALSFIYWINYTIGLPTEIVAATIMLSYYDFLNVPNDKSTVAWIFGFIIIIITINLFDVAVYAEIEYYSSIAKVLILLALIIFMIILNRGGAAPLHKNLGFLYWDSSKSNAAEGFTYGAFRPTFDLRDVGTGALNGIGGAKGRLLSVIVATVVSSYAYVGTEIVLIAAGEAKNPRKSLPSATKRIFWRIVIFYVLGIFVVGLNIYSGDPRLIRYYSTNDGIDMTASASLEAFHYCQTTFLDWNGFSNGNQSPWIIALQSASLCTFASVLNGFLVFFALSAGSSQLYASSRTLYYLAVQGKAPKIFGTCSVRGVPYVSVLFSGAFSSLAFLVVTDNTAYVFQRLMNICATTGLIVWTGMNLTFIRFYFGLKYRPDIISRDDPSYPYRSPLQPYTAFYGFITGLSVVLAAGFIVFLDGFWDTAFFFTSYGSLMLFVACYFGYKILRGTKIHKLDQLDFDTGRREMDKVIWEEGKFRNNKSLRGFLKTLIEYLA